MKLVLTLCCFLLTNCAGVFSGLSGQPIASVAVQRAGQPNAEPFMVAAADVANAEQRAVLARQQNLSEPVHGLYDAGAVARLVEATGK